MSYDVDDQDREHLNTELLVGIRKYLALIAAILEEVHETGLTLDDVEVEE